MSDLSDSPLKSGLVLGSIAVALTFIGWYAADALAPSQRVGTAASPWPYRPGNPVFIGGTWYLVGPEGRVATAISPQPPPPVDKMGALYAAMIQPPSPLYGMLANDSGVWPQPDLTAATIGQEFNGTPVQILGYRTVLGKTWANVVFLNDGKQGWIGYDAITNVSQKSLAGSGLGL